MPEDRYVMWRGVWVGSCGHTHESLHDSISCDSTLVWPWLSASNTADEDERIAIDRFSGEAPAHAAGWNVSRPVPATDGVCGGARSVRRVVTRRLLTGIGLATLLTGLAVVYVIALPVSLIKRGRN